MAKVVRLITQPERHSIQKMLDKMTEETGDVYKLDDIIAMQNETDELFNAPVEERAEIYRHLKEKYGDGIAVSGPGIPDD